MTMKEEKTLERNCPTCANPMRVDSHDAPWWMHDQITVRMLMYCPNCGHRTQATAVYNFSELTKITEV